MYNIVVQKSFGGISTMKSVKISLEMAPQVKEFVSVKVRMVWQT